MNLEPCCDWCAKPYAEAKSIHSREDSNPTMAAETRSLMAKLPNASRPWSVNTPFAIRMITTSRTSLPTLVISVTGRDTTSAPSCAMPSTTGRQNDETTAKTKTPLQDLPQAGAGWFHRRHPYQRHSTALGHMRSVHPPTNETMNPITITFDRNGIGSCLYTELIDLAAIGSLQIQRATNIEFNNTTQFWEVKNLKGKVLFFSRSRAVCHALEAEHV